MHKDRKQNGDCQGLGGGGMGKVKVKITQLSPALCNPMVYTVHGILQARILEWVAFPSLGDLPTPGIEPRSSTLQADSLPTELPGNILFFFFFLPQYKAIKQPYNDGIVCGHLKTSR